MKLVPFMVTQKKVQGFQVTTLHVFLSYAGKRVWLTENPGLLDSEEILSEYCEPNGLFVSQIDINKEKETAYLRIDPIKTNLSDFYTWEEALQQPGKPECWRRFYFFENQESSDWWSPKGLIEGEIQDYGTIETLFNDIKNRSLKD